jgi:hypothetical protein
MCMCMYVCVCVAPPKDRDSPIARRTPGRLNAQATVVLALPSCADAAGMLAKHATSFGVSVAESSVERKGPRFCRTACFTHLEVSSSSRSTRGTC